MYRARRGHGPDSMLLTGGTGRGAVFYVDCTIVFYSFLFPPRPLPAPSDPEGGLPCSDLSSLEHVNKENIIGVLFSLRVSAPASFLGARWAWERGHPASGRHGMGS